MLHATSGRIVLFIFFFQAEDGIRDVAVTGVQTCALPILCQHPGETTDHQCLGAAPIPIHAHAPCAFLMCRRSPRRDRKSTRLNSSHGYISYAVFCLKKKKTLSNIPYS